MKTYSYGNSVHKRLKKLRVTHHGLVLVLLILLAVVAGVGVLVTREGDTPTAPQQTAVQNLGYYDGAPKQWYQNEYFSFGSSKDWQFSTEESEIGRQYVYISRQHSLVEYKLTVWVGEVPDGTTARYVVPVTVNDVSLEAGDISLACDSDEFAELYDGALFTCDSESSAVSIAALAPQGGHGITIPGNDGRRHVVGLLFHDLTGRFHSQVFTEIINNFKIR